MDGVTGEAGLINPQRLRFDGKFILKALVHRTLAARSHLAVVSSNRLDICTKLILSKLLKEVKPWLDGWRN